MWGYLATECAEFPGFYEFYQNVDSAEFLEKTYANLPDYEVEVYTEDCNMYGIVYKNGEYVDCVIGTTLGTVLAEARQAVRVEEVKHRLNLKG